MLSVKGGSQPAVGSCIKIATQNKTKKKPDGSRRQRQIDRNKDSENELRLSDGDDTKRKRPLDTNMDKETEQRLGLQKDRSRRQRLERNKDYETEQCFVCKGFFKKGKGLKIHQTKAGCLKKAEEHRKVHKSETIEVQDKNHSDHEGRVLQYHGGSEVETIRSTRHKEEEEETGRKPETKDQRGKPLDRKSEDAEKMVKLEETEIHVEEDLYNEVQAWVKKEIGAQETPARRLEKKTQVPHLKNQPKLSMWFSKEVRKDQEDDKKELEKAESSGKWKEIGPEKNRNLQETWKKEAVQTDKRPLLGKESKSIQQDIRKVLLKDRKGEEEVTEAAGATEDFGSVEAEEREEDRPRPSLEKRKESKVIQQDVRKVLLKDGKAEQEFTGETVVATEDSRTVKIEEREKRSSGPSLENEQGNRSIEDEEEIEKLLSSINSGNPQDKLVQHWLSLTKEDFRTLQGSEFINDKIIDSYMKLIEQRSQESPNLPRTYACTTFLFTKLKAFGVEVGMEQTQNWFKEDLREKEVILCPIHRADHWSLVAIDTRTKTVNYLDSLQGSRRTSPAPGIMKKFIEKYYRGKGEKVNFKVRIRKDAPVQGNGFDCGVFACKYAERESKGEKQDFRQEDLVQARKAMARELMRGRLDPRWVVQGRDSTARPEKKKKKSGGKKQEYAGTENKADKGKRERCEDRRERVNWPKANSKEWEEWGESVAEVLRTQNLTPENKAVIHPLLIYTLGKERFGTKEKKERVERQTSGPSRRQRKCKRLREEINKLKEAYLNAREDQREGIEQLQEEKLRQLRLTKRAESIRKNRQKYVKNCNKFLSQPFDFAREVISPRPKGDMKSSKEETEEHLSKAHGSTDSKEEKDAPEDLHQYEKPTIDFDDSLPTWKEFSDQLKKTRNKSAPGPNGVPYLVYKRCPGLARLCWSYLKGIWKRNIISRAWRQAEGVFIPKEEGAREVDKFRTISLLNVEGKLFFALKAKRLLTFALANNYIDTSIQKGGIPEVSGCLEHTALLSQLIREAKTEKGNLVVTWLDIANAYGSMPHSLILTALERTHVPERMRQLVKSYYSDIKIRFTTKEYTTDWQQVEKGIITGCTISVILFAITMTMLVMSVKGETKGPKSTTGQQQQNSRLFMDDITTTTGNLVQTKYLLEKLMEKLKWAGLEIKPGKCRSLVIIKGEISRKSPEINGTPITSITEKSVKYLGKVYDKSLGDRAQIEEVVREVKGTLRKIERCKVPGRYKAWILQHMLLPKLMWPLTIYNVPLTKVNEIQKQLTGKLKKWLGLPRSLSEACLYARTSKLQMPFRELTEEFKAAKTRLLITLQGAEDQCVKGAGVCVDGGRKADTQADIVEAESRLRTQEITGIPNQGKEGLGLKPRKYFSKQEKKEKRRMVVNTVREMEEEKRMVKMTGLIKQGAPMNWEVPERRVSSRDIVSMQEGRLAFLVKSVYDLLPTPENRNRWFSTEERCQLCGGVGSMAHILSGCPTALGQGRYRWRHDQVLKEIAHHVEERRKEGNKHPGTGRTQISFVKPGEKILKKKRETGSYLDGSADWRMQVDLDQRLKVPAEVAPTDLRPDLIMVSSTSKRMGVMELTVPSEDRVEVSNEMKRKKYATLQVEGKKRGWVVEVWAVEVGCRGFPAGSMSRFLKDLGITGRKKRGVLEKIAEAAERASRWLWRCSSKLEWGGKISG